MNGKKWQRGILFLKRNYHTIAEKYNKTSFAFNLSEFTVCYDIRRVSATNYWPITDVISNPKMKHWRLLNRTGMDYPMSDVIRHISSIFPRLNHVMRGWENKIYVHGLLWSSFCRVWIVCLWHEVIIYSILSYTYFSYSSLRTVKVEIFCHWLHH